MSDIYTHCGRYRCPNCGETRRLEACIDVTFTRVPLDSDGDFNALSGRLYDTEIGDIQCLNCLSEATPMAFEVEDP